MSICAMPRVPCAMCHAVCAMCRMPCHVCHVPCSLCNVQLLLLLKHCNWHEAMLPLLLNTATRSKKHCHWVLTTLPWCFTTLRAGSCHGCLGVPCVQGQLRARLLIMLQLRAVPQKGVYCKNCGQAVMLEHERALEPQVEVSLRGAGKSCLHACFLAIKMTAFLQEAVGNITSWTARDDPFQNYEFVSYGAPACMTMSQCHARKGVDRRGCEGKNAENQSVLL
eukprot:scaffold11145_cov22-Tisochrysis_lutea.AAC.1